MTSMAGIKTIALFGATGPTGRHIIEEALKRGYNLSVYKGHRIDQ
ncbi:hypothetical protein SB783_39135 [Paraburkholderia sp. SIMBA_009]